MSFSQIVGSTLLVAVIAGFAALYGWGSLHKSQNMTLTAENKILAKEVALLTKKGKHLDVLLVRIDEHNTDCPNDIDGSEPPDKRKPWWRRWFFNQNIPEEDVIKIYVENSEEIDEIWASNDGAVSMKDAVVLWLEQKRQEEERQKIEG